MKSIWIIAFAFVNALLIQTGSSQQTYTGKVYLKTGDVITGEFSVDMNGTNSDQISISTVETSKTKTRKGSTKQETVSKSTFYIGLVKHIEIKDSIYYFRDIKVGYNDKYEENAVVRLVTGNLDCGIFQRANATGNEGLAVKLPSAEFSKLVSTEFDYYLLTSGWHMMSYRKCKDLYEKMTAKLPGYNWTESTPKDERVAMWKQWIAEYNSCRLAE